jgi:hypothetical protein
MPSSRIWGLANGRQRSDLVWVSGARMSHECGSEVGMQREEKWARPCDLERFVELVDIPYLLTGNRRTSKPRTVPVASLIGRERA